MVVLVYSKNHKYQRKTKYIQIRYHYVRYMVIQKDVIFKHIFTNKMVVGSLTKPIVRNAFVGYAKFLDYVECGLFVTDYLEIIYSVE